MKKVIKLTATDLQKLVNKVIKESEHEHSRYMFFSNLEQSLVPVFFLPSLMSS